MCCSMQKYCSWWITCLIIFWNTLQRQQFFFGSLGCMPLNRQTTGLPSLFVWCAVQLQWPYRLITLALLKSKFRAVKLKKIKLKLLNYITAMLFKLVFLCLFWWFVPCKSGIFLRIPLIRLISQIIGRKQINGRIRKLGLNLNANPQPKRTQIWPKHS